MNVTLIFNHYYRPLCLYALHYINNVESAEDVVQDCFVRLMEQTVPPQNARAWLYTAVRNRCIDALRRQQGQAPTLPASEATVAADDDELQERSEREARLWEAIGALPPGQRQVLLMAKRDGLSYREIAQQLGISQKTVEHQLSSALKKLRR